MSENASVVVFPSIYSQNKINLLISNIKKILKIKEQRFSKIQKDDSVIVVEAADPVFTSSFICYPFYFGDQPKKDLKELSHCSMIFPGLKNTEIKPS